MRSMAALGIVILLTAGAAGPSFAIDEEQLQAEAAALAEDPIATLEEARRAMAVLVARAEEGDIWLFLNEDGTVTYIEIETFYLLAINWEAFEGVVAAAAVAAALGPLIEENERATIEAAVVLRQRIAAIGAEIARLRGGKPAPDEVIVIVEDAPAPAPGAAAANATYANCAAAVADVVDRQIIIAAGDAPHTNPILVAMQEACEGHDRGVENLYIYPLGGARGGFCGQFAGAIGNAVRDGWMDGIAEWFANRAEACAAGQQVYCYGAMLVMRSEQFPPPNVSCN